MAIDATQEQVLTLSEATRHVPVRRGKKTHASTIWRWAKAGLRGVRLETIQVGGSRCTSVEALQRFFERLTAAVDGPGQSVTPARRRREIERAERELDAAGI